MRININWLKEYVTINLPAEKLAHRLTMAGMEVEKIHSLGHDTILEIEITPNRPDCLNVVGLARETAAALNKNLNLPKFRRHKKVSTKCPIEILDRQGCLRYIGTVIQGVAVKAAPEVMTQHLTVLGLRPINNIVDITNFCLLETGQPLHAFDYDKLIGGKIIVRRARAGEKIVTIDGIERTLDPSILVIADAQRPVAIAGIMGGKATEVTETTKNVLLESAYFKPAIIRRGCRTLGLGTDSSYRFERGVDLTNVDEAAFRAVALIFEQAGGKVTARSDVFPGKRKFTTRRITIATDQINTLLGAELTMSQSKTILKKLGFKVTVDKTRKLHLTAPSFRNDVRREEDVVEEIARVVGYDNLPWRLPEIKAMPVTFDGKRSLKRKIRTILLSQGFQETVLYSLTNQKSLERCLLGSLPAVRIQNPLTQDQEFLRPAVLPTMLPVVELNFNRGQKDLRLYELGKIYPPSGEKEVLSLILTGRRYQDWRLEKHQQVDYYDIKGVLLTFLERLHMRNLRIENQSDSIFSAGKGSRIVQETAVLGVFGKLETKVLKNWDVKLESVYFAQVDLEEINKAQRPQPAFQPLGDFPAVVRDVSLAVKKDIAFETVADLARQNGQEILRDVIFIEQYTGEKIPTGYHGLVFSLVYQSLERTLTEEEVNAVHQTICQEFFGKLKATIR
jgi:phenylalanyl-tRNA synthetase beta chain